MAKEETEKPNFFDRHFRRVKKDKNVGEGENEENTPPLPPPAPKPVEYRPYGLKVVAEGKEPTIDIVAVHGLNGHREKTWTAKNKVNWLSDEDMLAEKIPNARIFVWGYNASTHSIHDYMSQIYLHQHGSQLISDLADHRELDDTTQRPIIFVGHSLGGIVIKSALMYSASTNENHLIQHRPIKVSTYGILFMGTPHSGGNGVTLGRVAQDIASVFVNTNDNILKHLEKQSEWLIQQQDQYAAISPDFVTKFGWETDPTPLFGGLRSMVVVPQWSAVGWKLNAEAFQVMADHTNMVKFQGKEDPEFTKVWKKLAIMAKNAKGKVEANWILEQGKLIRLAMENHHPQGERTEYLVRLTEPAADLSDNHPFNTTHLTRGAPDVVYDRERKICIPKPEATLGRTLECIEETDEMRDQQLALIQAATLYEQLVGSADAKLCTGISLESRHVWGDVLREIDAVRHKYRPREGSNSIAPMERGFRTFEAGHPGVERWLCFLPSIDPCASMLCGGLRMILSIIWRTGTLSNETYDTLEQIPTTISRAQVLTSGYNQQMLSERVGQLYCAILDILQYIVGQYSRILTKARHAQFAPDFQLMNRCQRLIDLEEAIVENQRVRVQALNTMKEMEPEEWELILAALDEDLVRAENISDIENQNGAVQEASVNANLYSCLCYDSSQFNRDLNYTMSLKFYFSKSEKARVSWLLHSTTLCGFILSLTSNLILINGNEAGHKITSPASVYCGMITRALRSEAPRVVLSWYCGLNRNEDAAAMLRSLIGQLLDHLEATTSPTHKVWYAGLVPSDPAKLFEVFSKVLGHVLKSAVVFCIIDGISFYEDHERAQDLGDVISALAELVGATEESEFVFKALLTSPSRSEVAKPASDFAAPNLIEVVVMPSFVDLERSNLDEDDLRRDISRRSSISSAGGSSIYIDASEYLDHDGI